MSRAQLASAAAATRARHHVSSTLPKGVSAHLALCGNDPVQQRAPYFAVRPEPKPPLFLLTLEGAVMAALCIINDPEFAYTATADQAQDYLTSLSNADLHQLSPKTRRAIERL